MSTLHVLCHLTDGNVEVEIEAEDGSSDEHQEDRKGGVLKIRHLNLHRSKFDAPSCVGIRWRWLEAQMLPIGRLKVLEMIRLVEIEVLQVLLEDDERVANEQMGKMRSEEFIHATIHQPSFEIFVHDQIRV